MEWQWLMETWQWLHHCWKELTAVLNKDIDWGSRIPAYAGLALSILALWKGRTTVSLYLGFHDRDDLVVVSNLSPHAIEITSVGVVEADGSLSDWFDGPDAWPGLPKRLEARSECTVTLHEAIAPFSAYQRKHLGRGGCFIRIAGGRVFSDPGRLRRRWWWLRSVMGKVFGLSGRRTIED
ncbi:hypothetical protein ACLPJF_13620 [Pseudomonas vlassakiae]|uniref:hypothetical protein n=1 Tax=Pseudomonas vlassakiae TaxID=485888 RepID=UPI003D2B9966